MLFHVQMSVRLPNDPAPDLAERLTARERQRALELRRADTWRHLWRPAGCYANVSIFDVEGPDELHMILSSLPPFPCMDLRIEATCRPPSALEAAAIDRR